MAKKVFVSFDFDNDRALRDFIVGQAKNPDSPFEVSDYSLKEEVPDADWLKRARSAITRADVFIVMLGSRTRNSPGVQKEVSIAKELDRKRFQIIGYQGGTDAWAVPDGGRTYSWSWDNLKKLLA